MHGHRLSSSREIKNEMGTEIQSRKSQLPQSSRCCDRTLTLSQRIELWRWPSFIAAQESLSSCMVHFSVRVLDKGILYWALTGLSANYLCSPCVFNVSINFLQPFQACCWIGFCRLKITEGLNVLFPIADSPSFRTPVELNFSISLYSFSCQ